MTRAITVRLEDADHAALQRQADLLQMRPGTLARILLHSGLTGEAGSASADALAALDRLVRRSKTRPPGDAAALVRQARADLEPGR